MRSWTKPPCAATAPDSWTSRSVWVSACARTSKRTRFVLDPPSGERGLSDTAKQTAEVTRLQLSGLGTGNVIVSTIREAEALEPLVRDGVVSDILYGVPLAPSTHSRLLALRARNPGLKIAVVIDHPAQLPAPPIEGGPFNIFVKLDNGYHRAGLSITSTELKQLMDAIAAAEATGAVSLTGFYSHAGHSYNSTSAQESMQMLVTELETVIGGAQLIASDRGRELVLSVGATPTALSATEIKGVVNDLQEVGRGQWKFELHAGVYTLLDLQQLATRPSGLGLADIALTIMAEVVSVYPSRREVLVAFGTTALGREPGGLEGVYPGWGVVTGWREGGERWNGAAKSGWIVGRISQEHAILTEEGGDDAPMELTVGMKVRVWPQHACIAGNGHGWYFVTDGDKVTDVWVRWRGW